MRSATRSARSSTRTTGHPHLRPEDRNWSMSRTRTRKGKRINIAPTRFRKAGFAAHVLRTRETLVINENMEEAIRKIRQCHAARLGVGEIGSLRAADRRRSGARGDHRSRHGTRARVQRIGCAAAANAGQQHERRAGERAPLRRDAAPHARVGRARRSRTRHFVDARCRQGHGPHRAARQGPAERRHQRHFSSQRRRRELPSDRGGRRHCRRAARN